MRDTTPVYPSKLCVERGASEHLQFIVLLNETPKIRCRLGKAVRSKRHKLGVSQEEFADICGLDCTYIGGIERGERNVTLVNIERIAKGLKMTLTELFRSL